MCKVFLQDALWLNLTHLDVCDFLSFSHFILVSPHIASLLEAAADLSQLRLTLLKTEGRLCI